jgi:hypothetical protein
MCAQPAYKKDGQSDFSIHRNYTPRSVSLCHEVRKTMHEMPTILSVYHMLRLHYVEAYHGRVHSACRGALNVVAKARCREGVTFTFTFTLIYFKQAKPT